MRDSRHGTGSICESSLYKLLTKILDSYSGRVITHETSRLPTVYFVILRRTNGLLSSGRVRGSLDLDGKRERTGDRQR